MLIYWPEMKEQAPMTLQAIEKKLGFCYDSVYGALIKEVDGKKEQIRSEHLERFFDDHGWFCTVYPTSFPSWNGVISDTNGKQLLNDPALFEKANSRSHAKSLILAYALKSFELQLAEILKDIPAPTIIESMYVTESAKAKDPSLVTVSDLTLDGQGLVSTTKFAVVHCGPSQYVVVKNDLTINFPQVGMVIKL